MEDTRVLSPLEKRLQALLDARRSKQTLRTLTLSPTTHIDFSSNDFLSLSKNGDVKAAFLDELNASTWPLGSGGSRLLDGNSSYAESLEHEISQFHNAECGLLFNSGFDANAGFFACVPQRGDVVVYDELIHASVHDGLRLSRARRSLPFRHNSVESLRKTLEMLKRDYEDIWSGKNHVFIAVEAIYSMDGDVAPLEAIVEAVDQILGRDTGYIVVDEAHATGVIGPEGRGLVCQLGLERRIFARLHTFGKAMGCSGAILLTSPLLRTYLLNYARPLIYSTSLPYPTLALIRTSYRYLQTPQLPALLTHLHTLITTFHTLLTTHPAVAQSRLLCIPLTPPQTPIFAIQLKEPKRLAKWLQERGMMVRAVVPPTVREGTERVRVCLHAGNEVAEVEALVGAVAEWCVKEMEVVGGRERTARL